MPRLVKGQAPKVPVKGGRKPGQKNRRTRAVEEAVARSQITPLQYMLDVLNDPKASPRDRQWAADKAGPYVHARLASVEVGNKDGKAFVIQALPSDMGLV